MVIRTFFRSGLVVSAWREFNASRMGMPASRYAPSWREKFMTSAGLIFFRAGLQVNATPLFAPTQIDDKTRTASFRVSLPLAKLPTGRYAVQAVVIGAGTQQAAFGRSYLALAEAPATPPPAIRAANPPH